MNIDVYIYLSLFIVQPLFHYYNNTIQQYTITLNLFVFLLYVTFSKHNLNIIIIQINIFIELSSFQIGVWGHPHGQKSSLYKNPTHTKTSRYNRLWLSLSRFLSAQRIFISVSLPTLQIPFHFHLSLYLMLRTNFDSENGTSKYQHWSIHNHHSFKETLKKNQELDSRTNPSKSPTPTHSY